MQTFISRNKNRLLHHLMVILICSAPIPVNAGLLLELYQQALYTNPTLLGRTYAIESAEAQQDQAFSGLLPQVSATGDYSYNRFHSNLAGTRRYEGKRGSIQARQALFDMSAFLRYEGAKAATQQSEQEMYAYRMQLAGEVLDRYLQVLEANDQIIYVLSEKEATESQIKRLRKMFERQMAKITDVYEVEAYYQSLNTLEIEARNEKRVALERLRETTGISLKEVAPLNKEKFLPVPENQEKWVQDAIINNHSLSALKYAIESTDKQISSAKSEHLPKLSLQLSETYSDQGFDNRQLPEYNVGTISIQLNIPIYEGGRVNAATREAIARQQMAEQQLIQVQRQIERETSTSFLNAQASHARIASTAKEVEAQNKAYEGQKKGYKLGVSTLIDVLENRRRLFKARLEGVRARYDYIRNLIGLRIWAGGLSIASIEEIDTFFTPETQPLSSTQNPEKPVFAK